MSSYLSNLGILAQKCHSFFLLWKTGRHLKEKLMPSKRLHLLELKIFYGSLWECSGIFILPYAMQCWDALKIANTGERATQDRACPVRREGRFHCVSATCVLLAMIDDPFHFVALPRASHNTSWTLKLRINPSKGGV